MFLVILSLPIEVLLFFVIRNANVQTARNNIEQALQVTGDIFSNSLSQKRHNLLEKVRALSSDYAFKPAANTNEHETVLSALTSYQARVDADVMLLLNMEGKIIADTLHPTLYKQAFYQPALINSAMNSEFGEAARIAFIDDKAFLLVAVPLFSPEPSHWIVMGFAISDPFALALQKTTQSHISILANSAQGGWKMLASTLSESNQLEAIKALTHQSWQNEESVDLLLAKDSFVSVILDLQPQSQGQIVALLQRSLDEALAPYVRLHLIVASGFLTALTLLLLGGLIMAGKITRPVTVLTLGAKSIEEGHYDVNIQVSQVDELGQLADRFNSMAKGLADRAKVRNLLGKVVSPAIAEELMSKELELGGEERRATILFSDIRNFTQLCEANSPKQIIQQLNTLFTRFSSTIDNHRGVVDKYIGDAMMALFGVPVADPKQAHHGVQAALSMARQIKPINKQLESEGFSPIGVGIGVNTGPVVAGNMGSQTRLNYTVVGDGVNLASRLEGLTKFYGVAILVSESTRVECDEILFREIDSVRVKGKNEGIKIFEPIELLSCVDPELTNSEEWCNYQYALQKYKLQHWPEAYHTFANLVKANPDSHLYQLYLDRVTVLRNSPYDPAWDGIFTHTSK